MLSKKVKNGLLEKFKEVILESEIYVDDSLSYVQHISEILTDSQDVARVVVNFYLLDYLLPCRSLSNIYPYGEEALFITDELVWENIDKDIQIQAATYIKEIMKYLEDNNQISEARKYNKVFRLIDKSEYV